MLISVIIITLNEFETLLHTINSIRSNFRFNSSENFDLEIIVSDGGSDDGTYKLAQANADKTIRVSRGRSNQLNNGAQIANGEILLFVHGDTIMPEHSILEIRNIMTNPLVSGGGFEKSWLWSPNVRLTGFLNFASRLWEDIGNWLVRLLKTFPGDNAIFVRKKLFDVLNGYAPIWICEDFDFIRRLKKLNRKRKGKLVLIRSKVKTSARRFEVYGFFKTVIYWVFIYTLWRLGMASERLNYIFTTNFPSKRMKRTILKF